MTITNPHSLAVFVANKKRIIDEARRYSAQYQTQTYVFGRKDGTAFIWRLDTDPRDVGDITKFYKDYSVINVFVKGEEQKGKEPHYISYVNDDKKIVAFLSKEFLLCDNPKDAFDMNYSPNNIFPIANKLQSEARKLNQGERVNIGMASASNLIFINKRYKEITNMDKRKYQSILKLSADSPEKLRACDVDRVMDAAHDMNCLDGFKEYLLSQRLQTTTLLNVKSYEPEATTSPKQPTYVAYCTEDNKIVGYLSNNKLICTKPENALDTNDNPTTIYEVARNLLKGPHPLDHHGPLHIKTISANEIDIKPKSKGMER